MKRLRQVLLLLCLPFAIAIGQQGALLHGIGHALQKIAAPDKHSAPAGDACEKCVAYAPLVGGMVAAALLVALVAAAIPRNRFIPIVAPRRTVVTARSRAPPAFH